MNKISVKTGDTVLVISGKDAGKTGKILKVTPKTGRVIVEGVNKISKTHKARSAQDKSEIRNVEGTIDVSNVMVVCPKCGKATRVYHKVVDGKKVRVCKCGSSLDEKVKVEKKPGKKADAKAADVSAVEAKTEKKASTKTTAKAKVEAPAKKSAPKAETAVKATKASTTVKKTTTAKSSQRGV